MNAKEKEFRQTISDLNSKFDEFVSRFGANFSETLDEIIEMDELLMYFNEKCNDEGDTFLMKAIEYSRMDVVRHCLLINEIDINAENERGEKAIDIAWQKRNYDCMVILLSNNSMFPSEFEAYEINEAVPKGKDLKELMKRRVLLHESIKNGVISIVKELAEKENSLTFYSPENVTAIYCAVEHEKHEIYAYLLSVGAKLGEEEKDLLSQCDDGQLEKFHIALEEYFIPFENSHISKLISATKLLGNFTDVERKAVKDIFEWLNKILYTKLLMKAVQYENIEIIFDFNSELVDRAFPDLCSDEVYGLYVTNIQRIYIGAKNSILNEVGFHDVAGTVAHELCHRAMQMLYNNDACPYNEGIKDRERMLEDVHLKISESLKYINAKISDKLEAWEKVMKVYIMQPSSAELIVRVPHILGIYGEEKGKNILKENMPELFKYYSDFVHGDLVEYSGLPFFSQPLCSIETLSNIIGILNEEERSSSPFLTLTNYEDHMFELHGKSILLTSNTKLCMLHVYHVLKKKFPFHLQKQCLFIDLRDLDENLHIISKVSQSKLFYCLVLLWAEIDKEIEYFEYITDLIEKDKKVILIANAKCKQMKQHIQETKVLHYPWSCLEEHFKRKILYKRVKYQGMNIYLYNLIDNETASKIINPEVLSYVMEKNDVNIGSEYGTESLSSLKSLYITRSFKQYSYKSMINNLKKGLYYLLITGLQRINIENFKIDNQLIHELVNKSEIQPEKYLIVPKIENSGVQFYQEYLKYIFKMTGKSVYWLHYENGNFCLQFSQKQTDVDLFEEEILKEKDLAMKMLKQRVIIVADDPGAGKSTVITSLMNIIKREHPYIFLGRINLSDYAKDTSYNLSLHHIKYCSTSDDILEYFYSILGLKNCIERSMIDYFKNIEGRVITVFDSFDEIVPLFKENALKLLRTLLNETKIHISIFTRTHEKLDLEKEMYTSAISLSPFSFDDQVKFLNNFWQLKLESLEITNEDEKIQCIDRIKSLISVFRNINKENEDQKLLDAITKFNGFASTIQSMPLSKENSRSSDRIEFNGLDFEKYSKFVLQNVNGEVLEKGKAITSLPLHLYMIANIIYNENFTVRFHTSVFNLYFDFLDSKIKTYLREKCQMKSETRDSKIIFDAMREVILSTLTKVLGNLLDQNQLRSVLEKDDDCLKIVQRIGLVKEERGNIYFIHITIQEFVFFTLIKEKIKSDTLENEIFSEILFKDIYQRTLEYLDCFFQTDDAVKVNFSPSFLKNFNVCEKFIDYLKYYEKDKKGYTFQGCHIWKKIVSNHEKLSEKDEADRLPPKIVSYLKQSSEYNFKRFQFLTLCLNDEMLIEIFDQNANITAPSISYILGKGSLIEVNEVIKFLNMIVSHKRQTSSEHGETASVELKLFSVKLRNYPSGNLFHWVSRNKDADAFRMLLQFAEKIIDKKTLSDLLTEHDSSNFTILHHSGITGNRNIITILEDLEIYLQSDHFSSLLTPTSNKTWCFLKLIAFWNDSSIFYESLVEYLSELMDSKILRELFLQLDCNRSSIIHYAARNKNKRIFKITVEKVNTYLQDEEFEKFLRWRCYFMRSIFHVRGETSYELKDLNIIGKLIRKKKFHELLMAVDESGGTCVHSMCNSKATSEVISSNLGFVTEELGENLLEKFILTQDKRKNTFLHILADKSKKEDMTKFYLHLESILSASLVSKLLKTVNEMGEIVTIENNEGSISFKRTKYSLNLCCEDLTGQ